MHPKHLQAIHLSTLILVIILGLGIARNVALTHLLSLPHMHAIHITIEYYILAVDRRRHAETLRTRLASVMSLRCGITTLITTDLIIPVV